MPAPLLQILLVPVVTSVAIMTTRLVVPRAAGWIAVGGLLYTSALIGAVGIDIYTGHTVAERYLALTPNINLGLLADGLSWPILAVVNLICTALACYSIRYIKHRIEILFGEEPDNVQARYYAWFFTLFLFFPVGFIGTILSTNLVSLYFFLEVLTITLFFLMATFGYRDRVRVAFMSLAWGIVGALLFLVATLMTYAHTGSFEISHISLMAGAPTVVGATLLFLIGLTMKLAIVPFHVWMPPVHAEHPTCIAGLLAVYANLALYIIVRVLVLPLGEAFEPFGMPLMVLALVTMIYGSLLALAQTDIKRLAACSTISQIAYSTLGVGALTSAGVEGGLFFFLSHIMGKTLFFSAVGIVVYTTGIRDMRQLGGLAKKMPLTAILWITGSMMLSGFPPFSSFAAEWIMFTGIFERAALNGSFVIALGIGGTLAILLTVTYTFRSARLVFFGPVSPTLRGRDLADPHWTMTAPLIVVALVSMVFGLYPRFVMGLIHRVVGHL